MKKVFKKIFTLKLILIRLLILMIGVGMMYALHRYESTENIYFPIFMTCLIFATGYAICYSKNWTNWVFYGILIALVVYYIKFKGMTVNNMKFYATGQVIAALFVSAFGCQTYLLFKKYRII